HGDLRVAEAVTFADARGRFPRLGRFLLKIDKFIYVRDLVYRAAMQLDHFQHRRDIVLRFRPNDPGRARIAITRERSDIARNDRALLVGFTGHDRGDRATHRAAFHAVVSVAVAHD